MAAPLHDPAVLAAWQGGETRPVYERYRDRPDDHSLYYLEAEPPLRCDPLALAAQAENSLLLVGSEPGRGLTTLLE